MDNKLQELILRFEAKSIFDSDNFSQDDADALKYLTDYSRVNLKVGYTSEKKSICIFGYKSNELPEKYGVSIKGTEYKKMQNTIKKYFVQNGITDVYVGFSAGTEIAIACAVLELREIGYPIKLHMVQVFKSYNETSSFFATLKRKADTFKVLTEDGYSSKAFNDFDKYLVEQADMAMFVCNAKDLAKNTFKVKNGMEDAKSKKKPIVLVDYNDLTIS